MYLLSASGTFDTILLLLIVWQVLRLVVRLNSKSQGAGGNGQRWTAGPPRPKGDVRIEQVEGMKHAVPPPDVEDAEFEEIKEERKGPPAPPDKGAN